MATSEMQSEDGSAARILAAATKILAEDGYAALSMRKVGAAVGLTQAAIYRHYRNKAELVSRIIEDGYSQLAAMTAKLEDGPSPPDKLLEDGFRNYYGFALSRPKLFRAILLQDLGPAGSEIQTLTKGVAGRRATFSRMVDLVDRGMRTGIFEMGDPELTAQALWASMFGLAARLAIEAEQWDADKEHLNALIDRQAKLLTRGLRPLSPRQSA